MAAEAPNEVLKQHELLLPSAKIVPPSLGPKSIFTSICSDGTAIRPVSMATPQRWPVNSMVIMKPSVSFTDRFIINLNVCLAVPLTNDKSLRMVHTLSYHFLFLTATVCACVQTDDMLVRSVFGAIRKQLVFKKLYVIQSLCCMSHSLSIALQKQIKQDCHK